MEDFFRDLTRGNIDEVKIILATIVVALSAYQLVLAAIGYRRWNIPRVLGAGKALWAHRAIGDVIFLLVLLVGVMCLAEYGWDEGGVHAVTGAVMFAVFAVKIGILRSGNFSLGRALPALGITLFVLLVVTWAASAGGTLSEL